MAFELKLTLKKNETPKSDKSPHYWVDAEGMRGVAWDAVDEKTGAKGVSIRVFREVKENGGGGEVTIQVGSPTSNGDKMLEQSSQLDKDYERLTAEAPNPADMPF